MTRGVWILALAALVACGTPETQGPQPAANAAERGQPKRTPLANSAGMANLTVENQTDRQLVLLYASPSGEEQWGPDLLEGSVVTPGDVVTFVLPPGWWDVKCVLEDEDVVSFQELELEADDYVLTLIPDQDQEPGEGEGEDPQPAEGGSGQ